MASLCVYCVCVLVCVLCVHCVLFIGGALRGWVSCHTMITHNTHTHNTSDKYGPDIILA